MVARRTLVVWCAALTLVAVSAVPVSVTEPANETGEPSLPVYGPPTEAIGAAFPMTAVVATVGETPPSSSVAVRVTV